MFSADREFFDDAFALVVEAMPELVDSWFGVVVVVRQAWQMKSSFLMTLIFVGMALFIVAIIEDLNRRHRRRFRRPVRLVGGELLPSSQVICSRLDDVRVRELIVFGDHFLTDANATAAAAASKHHGTNLVHVEDTWPFDEVAFRYSIDRRGRPVVHHERIIVIVIEKGIGELAFTKQIQRARGCCCRAG